MLPIRPVHTVEGSVALAAAGVGAEVTAATAATVASAGVTGTLGVVGAVGAVSTGADIYQSAQSGNWNQVAFDAGTLGGGLAVGGLGGGRDLAGLSGTPSSVPETLNPIQAVMNDLNVGNFDHSQGSVTDWLGTAPTPLSGGVADAGLSSGLATLGYRTDQSQGSGGGCQ